MWLEYIRYRFRLDKTHDLLELTQLAALKGLRNSPRCRGWRVLPAADDPSLLVLEIEWEPGAELTPFRGSEEFATIHSALANQLRSLEEADYSVDNALLRRLLGGPEALFRLAEDIVSAVLREPLLAWRFRSDDGAKRGRLGLWLLEVLGGPDLFSSSFPASSKHEGPLANDRLDLEERERLLEIALEVMPQPHEEQYRCIVGNLRAHLPVYPKPPSRLSPARLLGSGGPAPDSDVRPSRPSEAPLEELELTPIAPNGEVGEEEAGRGAGRTDTRPPSDGEPRYQTGVRARVEEDDPEAQAAGDPWPGRPRPPSPTLRSRASGRWPRWRIRAR